MTHGLDTSVIVRIISGLPEGAAEKVGQRIAADIADGEVFIVSALVLSEAYFALQHHYAFTKEEALQSLIAFSRTDGIKIPDSLKAILQSANLAKSNPGFVDRMIVSEYARLGRDTYSCEKSFRRLAGTVVI